MAPAADGVAEETGVKPRVDILINGQKVKFELEETERTAADVMAGVVNWATGNGRVMRSCAIGGKTFYGEDKSLAKIPINGLDEIRFEVVTPQEFALDALSDAHLFFRDLSGPGGFERKDFFETLGWCLNVVTKAQKVLGLDMNSPFMDTSPAVEMGKLLKFIEHGQKKPLKSKEILQEFASAGLNAELLQKLTGKLLEEGRKKFSGQNASTTQAVPEAGDVIKKLMSSQMELPEISKRIEKLTLELHTGGDVSAMNRLNEVSEKLTAIIHNLQLADRILPNVFSEIRTVDDRSISEELLSLTEIFKRIVSSFDTKDTVLLCDILEYELTPRLNTLNSVMDLLIRRLKDRSN